MHETPLIIHAREFKIVGYTPLDEPQEDGPNKWIQESVLELLTTFGHQGHSGMSAPFCIEYFRRLASFGLLSPLTGNDEEWNEIEKGHFQNIRSGNVFKNVEDDRVMYYCVDAVIFHDTKKDYTFTGRIIGLDGRIYSSAQELPGFPFFPKSFIVPVELAKHHTEDELYFIDLKSWEEAKKYYATKSPQEKTD